MLTRPHEQSVVPPPPPSTAATDDLAGDFETPEQVVAGADDTDDTADTAAPLSRQPHASPPALAAATGAAPDPTTDPAAFDEWLANNIQELLDAADPAGSAAADAPSPAASTPRPQQSGTATVATASATNKPGDASLRPPRTESSATPESLDAAIATAESVQEQLQTMTGMIEAAARPTTSVAGKLAELNGGPAEHEAASSPATAAEAAPPLAAPRVPAPMPATPTAAASTASASDDLTAAREAPAAIEQLDEFLAGQADNAVAGDFETVHDVMAVEQAMSAAQPKGEAPIPPAAGPVAAAADDGSAGAFQSPDEVADGVEDSHAHVAALSSRSPSDLAAATTVIGAAAAAPAVTDAATAKGPRGPRLATRLALMTAAGLRALARRTTEVAYRGCSLINKPLSRMPESRRNLLGYAGVLSLVNGALLLLARLFHLVG